MKKSRSLGRRLFLPCLALSLLVSSPLATYAEEPVMEREFKVANVEENGPGEVVYPEWTPDQPIEVKLDGAVTKLEFLYTENASLPDMRIKMEGKSYKLEQNVPGVTLKKSIRIDGTGLEYTNVYIESQDSSYIEILSGEPSSDLTDFWVAKASVEADWNTTLGSPFTKASTVYVAEASNDTSKDACLKLLASGISTSSAVDNITAAQIEQKESNNQLAFAALAVLACMGLVGFQIKNGKKKKEVARKEKKQAIVTRANKKIEKKKSMIGDELEAVLNSYDDEYEEDYEAPAFDWRDNAEVVKEEDAEPDDIFDDDEEDGEEVLPKKSVFSPVKEKIKNMAVHEEAEEAVAEKEPDVLSMIDPQHSINGSTIRIGTALGGGHPAPSKVPAYMQSDSAKMPSWMQGAEEKSSGQSCSFF